VKYSSWLLGSTRWASSFIYRCYVRYPFPNSEPNLMIAPRASAKERVRTLRLVLYGVWRLSTAPAEVVKQFLHYMGR
jgi:hypothetical protein